MNINKLLGKTLTEVSGHKYDAEITFKTTEGKTYKLLHHQSCCEEVRVEDICGELSDLIGSPITQAEETSNQDTPAGVEKPLDSFTWTFYRLATAKGQVVIRWLGESNGYYGEEVDFEEVL